ncbi:MAG: hypothetical protein ANABAC_2764 [Anaerolineae bacterium]|nr:MAG: hypothetical protein ANABAC_2764 [Anaerolineae bacterium]
MILLYVEIGRDARTHPYRTSDYASRLDITAIDTTLKLP